ncbi:hypothetical protein K1719_032914 [Acacia pycnantha]|nr:hypothetical protein K1719_032914 [Acacia pycnantha]
MQTAAEASSTSGDGAPSTNSDGATLDDLKKIATYKAVEYVESGMIQGLGTGLTAKHAVDRIDDLLRQGKLENIIGIPTSKRFHWGFHCQISIHTNLGSSN